MFGLQLNKEQRLVLYVLIGLSAIGLSYNHFRGAAPTSDEVVLREPGQGDSPRAAASDSDQMPFSNSQYAGKVVFQVVGCVKKPGVYSLPVGSRVMDAVAAAGGPKQDADMQAINLAAKIEDGSRISVPSTADTRPAMGGNAREVALRALAGASRGESGSASSGKLRTPGEGVVHINGADATELQRLPGVGPATAEKIMEYRRQVGKFTTVEQLMDVKGIGPKKLEKMRPFIAL